MEFKIQQKTGHVNHLYIIDDPKKISLVHSLNKEEALFVTTSFAAEQTMITLNRFGYFIFIYLLKEKKADSQTREVCRKAGADLQAVCNKHKLTEITITNLS